MRLSGGSAPALRSVLAALADGDQIEESEDFEELQLASIQLGLRRELCRP